MSEKQQGIVKWFNDEKGFGFIKPDNKGKDLFVHFSAIQTKGRKTLHEHDRVSFISKKSERGWQAEEVIVIDE